MEEVIFALIVLETILLLVSLFTNRGVLPVMLIYFGYTRVVYLDYFFGNTLDYRGLVEYYFSIGYGEIVYFFITHAAFLLLYRLLKTVRINSISSIEKEIPNWFYIILVLLILLDGSEYIAKSREEIGEAVTLIKLLRRNTIFYLLPLIYFIGKRSRMKSIFIILAFVVMLVSKEREPLLLISLLIFYKFLKQMSPVVTIAGAFIAGLTMLYWKALYIWYSLGSYNFLESVRSDKLELSRSEPMLPFITSIKIIEGDWLRYFPDFTYVSGTYSQLLRVFTSIDKASLSEENSIYFSKGSYGAAFSGIGESFLNLGFTGPVLLIIGLYAFFIILSRLVGKRAALVIFAMLIFKLMRTELSVVLKLQVIPLIISIIVFRFVTKRRYTHF